MQAFGLSCIYNNRKQRIKKQMNLSKIWNNLLVMGSAAITLASCNTTETNELGKWEPMVWETGNPPKKVARTNYVPSAGGEFIFYCVNYVPWFEGAVANGKYYYPPREKNDFNTLTTEWAKAEINGNKLKVTFDANETGMERQLTLEVTAGDIFDTFNFKQLAN